MKPIIVELVAHFSLTTAAILAAPVQLESAASGTIEKRSGNQNSVQLLGHGLRSNEIDAIHRNIDRSEHPQELDRRTRGLELINFKLNGEPIDIAGTALSTASRVDRSYKSTLQAVDLAESATRGVEWSWRRSPDGTFALTPVDTRLSLRPDYSFDADANQVKVKSLSQVGRKRKAQIDLKRITGWHVAQQENGDLLLTKDGHDAAPRSSQPAIEAAEELERKRMNSPKLIKFF